MHRSRGKQCFFKGEQLASILKNHRNEVVLGMVYWYAVWYKVTWLKIIEKVWDEMCDGGWTWRGLR